MSAVNTESIPPSHTNGVIEDGYDEDEKMKVRPADIDADMREMERRKRVESIMNSRLFREELERIIESQIKAGNSSAGLLQQISDMVGSKYSGINNHLFRSTSCAVPINDIRGVEAMGYAKGEKILRCKLAALFRLIDLYGWTQGIYNHVTARLSQQEEHFLVNPYGLLYSEVTASSLVKVDMQGNVIESGTTNFSVNVTGFQLHAAIYAARPDLKCIVHLHTPSVLAVSSLKDGLLPICQEAAVIGEISHHSYIGIPNEPEERDKIVRNLGPNNKVIFLTNHGALCCGETIEETFFYAYNTVNACETQLKVLPLGKDNVVLLSDETRKSMYDSARKIPENISPPVSHVPSAAAATEKRWRIGGLEFEALMRMLDNAGFRTGYVYRQPLIKGELPRPRNDVEVPPAVSSLGYLLEEEELYKGQWKKAFGGKGSDRIRWLNSPNVYQKVEILETGTSDPKKITKWVDANNEEWVADGSPSHTSTPVKIENALQFVPKNTNPKEFKKLQQQIKENRRADKITSGPQSHILEGVSWEEAKKLQDANISGTSDQVILVGAASKGIIQREYQHNATVYKTPYAKNPFDAVTDEEIENYKKDITRKQRGDSYYDEDESDALSSSLPPSGKRQNTGITSETEDESLTHEMRVIQIETTTVPKASQAEVVLSDDKANRKLSKNQAATKAFIRDTYDFYSEELKKFIVRIWEVKKMRPILKTIGESMIRPVCASICEKDYDSSPPSLSFPSRDGGEMKDVFKQIARELMTRLKQGSIFKQRSVRPAFLRVAPEAPEFRDVSLKSSSFDCSDTEITTLIELPRWQRGSRYSRGSLGSVHDFSSDPTTEDEEEDPTSPEKDYEKSSSFLSLSSYIGHEFENPEESNEMNSSTTKTNVSDDTSFDEITVICKQKNDDDAPQTEFNDADEIDDFDDTSLSSALMQDEDEDDGYDDGVADVEWNTYESLNDVDEDYFAHENGAAKPTIDHECVTSFIEKAPLTIGARYKPELAVIYEESHISDSKCSLKSILEDSATIFVQPQGELIDSIAIAAQPEFERSDTPDTYVIEDESSRADHLDTDVWNSLEKCIACADILLEHVKNAKINRNDSETVSSPMANFAASDVNGTGVDSDAHTISESSLISCLADSTEYLEALKNDSCSLDANDESDEIVLDSGILMEDVITCSSEGDYTDMKLHSEVVSTEIGPIVVPFDGRASSGSEEAEDAVWVTQIEKIFDFEVDDFCLNTLFDQSDESAAYHEDTELPDLSVEEEVTDFGLVYDSEPSNRRFSDLDSDHYADSVIQNDECSFDSVIDSDDQSLHDHLINDEISPALYTFRYDAESMSTRVDHMDHEHLDSIRASVLVNKPDSDSNHLSDNYINAGVTSNVPESVIAHCDDDTQPIPASTAVETETSSTPTSEHNLELNVSHRSQANGEVCEFIEQPNVAVDSEVTESPPKKTDFDSVIIRTSDAEYQLPCDVSEAFIGFKKVSEVFGESFLNDANNNEDSSHDPETEQDILCNDLPDVEKTSPRDEFKTDNNMDDDSSYVCKDSNLIVAAADETAKLSIADIPELTAEFEEEEEETPCKITTDNSIVKDAPCEDDIRAPEAEKDDRSVIESANFSNVAIVVDDHTEITESAIKTFENVAHQEAESDSEEVLASQQLEYEVELDADITGEENNNRISVDDANFLENHETVADVEAADNEVVCELEASAESSENNDDVTVVEMTMHNSIESSGKISENGSSPERSESVEFPEVDDCDMEVENDDVASESPESVRSPENDDIASESPGSVESSENDDVASESSESAEDDDVVSKLSESDKLSENDDVVSESSESIESSENDDAVSDSSESIESFENNHDIVVAENDEAASESSESAHLETENSGDDVTTMDKDAIPLPSECVEPSQCNDAFVATAIVENDSIPDLFEFFKVTENSDDEDIVKNNVNAEFAENIDDDDDVAANQLVELGESPESSDDIAIIENNPVHESSESAESTDMIDDAVAVQNGVICQSSEIVESTDENSDGVVESDNIGFPDVYESMVEHVGDVPVQSDAIDQPPEMADLAENDDNDVSIVENDVIFESPESDKLVETAESATIIDNTVAMQNLIGENSEIVESTRNNDDVSESEDIIVPDLSESIVKNVDDVLAQSDAIDQPSEMVNSPENGDNDVSIVVNNICELSESGEFVETVDNVVTVQNNDTSDDPPASVVEFSETIADVVELTDTTVENQSSSVIENIDEVSIPHYDLDQSSELDKSTGNILKSLETDESIETIDDVSNQPLESVVESPESNNDVKSDDIVIKDSSKWTAEDVENRSIENDSVFESSECVEVAENIGEVVSLQNDIVCEPEENIDDVSIPHYDLDQSSELDKSTGNILKSLETDESIETTDDVSNQPPPEWMAENVENRSIENDAVSESSESVEMAEKISEIASVENYIVYEPEETIEADELFDSNSDHFAAVENDVIQELTESTNNVDDQSTKNINIIENDPIHELSNGSSEKSEEVQTIENEAIAESCDNNDSAIIENNIDPTQSTESNTNATDAIDNNHPAFEPAFVRNKHLIAVSNQSISYSIGCDTNAEICSLLGYLNEKKIFVKNIAANNNNTANAISADTANSNVKEEVADTAVANSSNEMLDENYVTISDASSSKPEEDRERESSSSSQIDQSFVTISEASIDKSESSISLTPEHKTKPRYSPEQRKSRNNVKTRVQFTNRRSVKRTSSSQKKESTDEDDSSKRNNATSSSGSNNGAGDEKKPKLEPLDVTEYSVKLKLHIEWDNKRSSSDSTLKSSSFDDSLNCSESTSEGKRDFREENKTNADAKDNGQPYYHHRFEQVTRLLTDFKNDYPKFVSYEYFSPKIKFQTTPRKKQTSRNTARKSLSLDSSPSGRYHRYCHISTRDLNNVDSKCTTFNAVVTPKRNVSSPTVKNVNQTTNISKKRVNRKLLKSRNQINTNSSLKTSTPVLTAAQFVNQESIIENLTSNTLSPIVNSLEEFELIESLLSSCET